MDWDAILMAVNSDPSKPLNEGGVKIVKSVQRGVGNATSIAIDEVNPDKCIVLIDGIIMSNAISYKINGYNNTDIYYGKYGESFGGATLASVTADTLEISNVQNTYSWQLIEFY